jgi:peroxiredoxin
MSLTPSNDFQIGALAPDFYLTDVVTDSVKGLIELNGEQGILILFICNHCPFVKHINTEVTRMAYDFQTKGINFVAISSNDVSNYPQDSPEKMKELAKNEGFDFPYLYDESQEVAKAYKAACTPDIYLFDKELKCYYHGQIDDSRPGNNIPVTGKDLRQAMQDLLEGKDTPTIQKPSIGCNIKWK